MKIQQKNGEKEIDLGYILNASFAEKFSLQFLHHGHCIHHLHFRLQLRFSECDGFRGFHFPLVQEAFFLASSALEGKREG
ncbi:hypothetical protein Csa_015306 [Cucumis sativus]|nr:hypothetical protein Csa_015306 [Cucumis sativus]